MLDDAAGKGTYDDQALKPLRLTCGAIPAPSKRAAHPGPDPSDWSKSQVDLNLAHFLARSHNTIPNCDSNTHCLRLVRTLPTLLSKSFWDLRP
jgi:hypothetical protein